MTISLTQAQAYYEKLRGEIHAVFVLLSDFDAVFFPNTRPEVASDFQEPWQKHIPRTQLLTAVASRFFQDLHVMMHHQYVLMLSRLGDPDQSPTRGGLRQNLTILGMQARLTALDRNTSRAAELAGRLCAYIDAHAKPARNQIVAHADLETRQLNPTLGVTSDETMREFHHRLQQYSDVVAETLDLSPAELVGHAPGDALDLMRAVEWAYKVRLACVDAQCPFQMYDIKPVRGSGLP